MNFNIRRTAVALSLLFLVTGCKTAKDQTKSDTTEDKFFSVSKLFDAESNTFYFLTKISHRTKDGKLIKLPQWSKAN